MNGYFPLYRGQAKDWTLLPSIARKEDRKHNSFPDKIQTIEKKVLQLMKRLLEDKSTKNFIKQRFLNGNYMNEQDWSLYFQARHLGLPTRLIDFTASIETASYFAVDSLSDDDGELWIFCCPREIFAADNRINSYLDIPISNMEGVIAINHPFDGDVSHENFPAEYRKHKQNGLFVMQSFEHIKFPLNENPKIWNLFMKVKIPQSSKSQIRAELIGKESRYAKLSPDLPLELSSKIEEFYKS
jgi:hypothetical protein